VDVDERVFASLLDANTSEQRQGVLPRRLAPLPLFFALRQREAELSFKWSITLSLRENSFSKHGHGNFRFTASRTVSVKTMARLCTGRRAV
jgi:hypothetical protein